MIPMFNDPTTSSDMIQSMASHLSSVIESELDARMFFYMEPNKVESSYLLDATRPNRLCFHQFGERNWLNLNGLLRQPIEQFAA